MEDVTRLLMLEELEAVLVAWETPSSSKSSTAAQQSAR